MVSMVVEFLQKAGGYYLATSENNDPKVRPMGFIANIDGKAYIPMSSKEGLYNELRGNNKIAITTGAVGSQWIRVSADVEFSTDDEVIEKFYGTNEKLRELYPKDVIALVYLTNGSASLCSFTEEPKICSF